MMIMQVAINSNAGGGDLFGDSGVPLVNGVSTYLNLAISVFGVG